MKVISTARLFTVLLSLCVMFSVGRGDEAKGTTQSAADTVTQSTEPVNATCSDGSKCWLQLAKTLQSHPNARHITVLYNNEWEDSALSTNYVAYRSVKLFFNSQSETVDLTDLQYWLQSSYDQRVLYKKVSKRLLLKWMAQDTDWTTQDFRFDTFARHNGIHMFNFEWISEQKQRAVRVF